MTDREDLEDLVFGYEALRAKWQQAEAQRDTLLAALRFCEAADIARRGGDQSYEDDRIERTARAAIAGVEGPTEEQRIGAAIEGIIQHAEGDLVDRMSTDKGPVFYDADQERWVEGKP